MYNINNLTTEIKECRVCGSKKLTHILSLGEQYITNFVEQPSLNAEKGPLDLVLCDPLEGGCGLLQLKNTFNHDILYKKYWYRSGISTTMVKELSNIVDNAEKLVKLNVGDVVIDIGSNDGTLLKQYKTEGIIKVGFEPSNLWELTNGNNVKILHDYFNFNSFNSEFPGKKAEIITSIAMFYDLENPNSFVSDIKRCLAENGVWIIQMNYLGLMLENNTFDNISHEHLEYYSLLTLEKLLQKHALEVFDVELNNVNGGSFRVYIRHLGAQIGNSSTARGRLKAQRDYELNSRLESKETYINFARRIEKIKTDLIALLNTITQQGKKVYIYGASTRGLVLLQFAGIDNKLISAATDKNPDKWGKYIVGTGIKIIPLTKYRQEKPDYLFVLPYHFIDEIKEQEKEFINRGGKLIIAIPNVRVIGE